MGLTPLHNSRVAERDRIASLARWRAMGVWCATAAGIFGASALWPLVHVSVLVGIGCVLAAVSVVFIRRAWFLYVLLAAACVLSSGWYQLRVRSAGEDDLGARIERAAAAVPTQSAIVKVRGVMTAPFAMVTPAREGLGHFLHVSPAAKSVIRVTELEENGAWVAVRGKLWVRVDLANGSLGSLAGVGGGDAVEVTGLARGLREPSNPGEFDTESWAADYGYAGSLSLSSPELVQVRGDAPGIFERVVRTWEFGRSVLTRRAHDALVAATTGAREEDRALLLALVLGETPTDQTLNQAFLRLGLAHVLAISGFHLVVMVQVFLFMLRLTGDRGRMETALAIAMVLGYMAIIPAQAPILRSGAICIIMLLAEWLGRRYDTMTLLIWVATALLLVHPTDLFSLGYELSCGLTVILVWLGDRSRDVLFEPRIEGLAERPGWWCGAGCEGTSADYDGDDGVVCGGVSSADCVQDGNGESAGAGGDGGCGAADYGAFVAGVCGAGHWRDCVAGGGGVESGAACAGGVGDVGDSPDGWDFLGECAAALARCCVVHCGDGPGAGVVCARAGT